MSLFKSPWILRIALGVAALMLMIAISVAYVWVSFKAWLETPLQVPSSGFHFDIEAGHTLSHTSQDLSQQGVLTHARWLNWYARYYHKEKIHPGEYALEQGITPVSLLEKLNKGDVVLHQIVFIEGTTFRQMLEKIDDTPNLKHLLSHKTDAERLALLQLPIAHPEGWFFPDTYTFSKGTTDVEILTQAYTAMRKLLDEFWSKKMDHLPYESDYQALIMASIIEKETGSANERDQIAGVFIRRLQQSMKLQTDPTVIYGMGETYTGKISRDDLNRPTPYNTYVIKGLPPTPIAMPSKAALYAAFHPDAGNALYFVARGDGTSEFSATLAEHQKAVARYQLQRASDYRSAPK